MGNYRGFEVRNLVVGDNRFTKIYHVMTGEDLYTGFRITAEMACHLIDKKYADQAPLRCRLEVGDAVSGVEAMLTERPTETIRRLQAGLDPRAYVPPFVVTCHACDLTVEPARNGTELYCPYCQVTLAVDDA